MSKLKLFSKIFATAIIVSVVFAVFPSPVFAATTPTPTPTPTPVEQPGYLGYTQSELQALGKSGFANCMASIGNTYICSTAVALAGGALSLVNRPVGFGTEAVKGVANSGNGVCGVKELLSSNALWCALTFVVGAIYWILGHILSVAGILFDSVIDLFVLKMGLYVHGNAAVTIAWKIVRNLLNIGIIGGLVAVGIGTILQTGYKAEQWLSKLIIAALLVNFSFFFTGAVIDASNFVAGEIYKSQIVGTVVCAGGVSCASTISETIVHLLKLGTVDDLNQLSSERAAADTTHSASPSQYYVLIGLVAITLQIGLIIIFFITSFLLLGRFVALVLLLITSPVGIAGINIPYLSEKYAGQWWTALTGQALFAPIYILLLSISLKVAQVLINQIFATPGSVTQGIVSMAQGNQQGTAATVNIILGYIIVLTFLFLSLSIARSMSKEAAQFKQIYDFTGMLGRNTIGRGASILNRDLGLSGWKDWGSEDEVRRKAPLRAFMARTVGNVAGRPLGTLAEADYGDGKAFAGKKEFSLKEYFDQQKKDKADEERRKAAGQTEIRTTTAQPEAKPSGIQGVSVKPIPPQPKGGQVIGTTSPGATVPEGFEAKTANQRLRETAGAAIAKPFVALGKAVKDDWNRQFANNKAKNEAKKIPTVEEGLRNYKGEESTTPAPIQNPENMTTVAAAGPIAGLPLTGQDRMRQAELVHETTQIQGDNTTIVNALRDSGVHNDEEIRALEQMHTDHLFKLRKETEATASAHAIEEKEVQLLSKVADHITDLQQQLAATARSGGVASGGRSSTEIQSELNRVKLSYDTATAARSARATQPSMKAVGKISANTKV